MTRLIPEIIKRPLRQVRASAMRVSRQLKSARDAFSTESTPYRMDICDVDGFRVAYRKGTADERVLAHSFANDIFFTNLKEYSLGPTHTVIDVGAHIGTVSLLAASRAPAGRIFAIEACLETFNYLRVNVALNQFANIETAHLALADRRGETKLFYDDRKGNWGHTTEKQLSNYFEVVRPSRLRTS